MANPYYNHTSGVPAVQTRGSSPNMRAEFDAVATGFNGVYTEILALAAAIGIAVKVSEVPVASSATTDIGNGYGPVVKITGTNPITSFGANYNGAIFLRFADALLLTHSSSLVLPGAANITTVAGDACIAVPIGNPASGWRIAAYCRMSQTLIDDVAVRTSSTYANPAWLTSLAWSKLTGVPTTLAGYGITDAPTKTGSGASGSWGIDITGTAALSLAPPTAAAAGTADAITATFSPAITAWTNGLRFTLTGCSANATTTPTVNPNGIGAKTIVKQGNLSLSIGDMPPQPDLQYNSTYGAAVLLNPNPITIVGFRNRLINGGMAIDQRNAGSAQTFTAATALAYCVDRWYGYCTGANVTGQRVADTAPNQFNYRFTGAASVTKIGFAQRIEAVNSQDLAGQTVTLAVDIANSLLTTVTWTAWYANTADTFGTLASPTRTQIATGTFTVNSALTRYSTNISIPSAATTGIEVEFSVGAQTSGTWTIGRAQLELGGAATAFEQRPIAYELAQCQRYYVKTFKQSVKPAQNTGDFAGTVISLGQVGGAPIGASWKFPATLRIGPPTTITTYSPNTATANWSNNGSSPTVSVPYAGDDSVAIVGTVGVIAGNAFYIHVTAEAEL